MRPAARAPCGARSAARVSTATRAPPPIATVPTPSPARAAAPNAVVSVLTGLSTGTPSRSAWNCMQQVVARRAAIDAQFRQRLPAILLHGLDEIGGLEGDALERRACQVRAVRAARQSDDGAACRGIPLRRSQSRKRRHQVHVAGVGNRWRPAPRCRRSCSMMPRPSRSHCTVAPPMNTPPSSAKWLAPPRRIATVREQSMTRGLRLAADVHEREAAGAVGVLGHAGRETALAEQARPAGRRRCR